MFEVTDLKDITLEQFQAYRDKCDELGEDACKKCPIKYECDVSLTMLDVFGDPLLYNLVSCDETFKLVKGTQEYIRASKKGYVGLAKMKSKIKEESDDSKQ